MVESQMKADVSRPCEHIALFVPSLVGGGAERVMVTLANEFVRLGHRIDLLVASSEDSKYTAEIDSNVNVIYLNKSRVLSTVPALGTYLRKERPRVLLTTLVHASIVASVALTLYRCSSTAFVARETISTHFIEPTSTSLKHRFIYWLAGRIYRRAKGVISVSDEMTPHLKSAFKLTGNVTTIYNPVVTDKLLELAERSPEFEMPWSRDEQHIVTACRLVPSKDLLTLIRAFSIAREQLDFPLNLVLLGDGPERSKLEQSIHDAGLANVVWMPGFLENPFPYFRSSVCYVLSSVREGLPNALIQAMACGTSVIATNCPTGPTEILGNGKYGELVGTGDAEEMAEALVKVCSGKRRSDLLEIVQLKYGAKEVAEKYLEYLMEVSEPSLSS